MKRRFWIVIVAAILASFTLMVFGGFKTIQAVTSWRAEAQKKREEQNMEVELYFEDYGYEVDIINPLAYGREQYGPFGSGWLVFDKDIGDGTVYLYRFEDVGEVDSYMAELPEKIKNRCFISSHYVFYYNGSDEAFISAIQSYCENN